LIWVCQSHIIEIGKFFFVIEIIHLFEMKFLRVYAIGYKEKTMAITKWSKHRAKHDEIARLSTMMDEMKREFDAQKQGLEQKISHLERELTQTQLEVQSKAIRKETEGEPTSRRRMLKRLGAAAAGLAVASVAVGQEAQVVEAGGTPLNINDGATPLTPLVNLTAGLTTLKTSGSAGFQALTLINDLTGTSTPNAATNYYPYDALVASSTNGVAVNAFSTSGSSAVLGVQNSNSLINTDVTANLPAITTIGGITGSTDSAKGVVGLSRSGAGVFGFGSGDGGYGAVFQVASDGTKAKGSAPLLIVPEPQIGQPNATGITHLKGEIHVDASGDVWVCTGLGTTGGIAMSQTQINKRFPGISQSDQQRLLVGAAPTFTKLGSGSGSGSGSSSTIVYLDNPIRIVGPNNTVNTAFAQLTAGGTTPVYVAIEGTWTNANTTPVTATIPTNAVAVIGTVAIIGNTTNGFATLYPANAPSIPFIATINYRPGAGATNNGFNCKLGAIPSGPNAGKMGIGVVSSQNCTMALDVVAYVL
jgi:hypothetical protein